MDKVDQIIRSHVLWSMGAGLIPVPIVDIAAVTGIQLDMINQLAKEYKIELDQGSGKAFITALTGGTMARLGASVVKAIPVVGTVIGGVSMAAMSGASTYAVAQVVTNQFDLGKPLFEFDAEKAKESYKEAFVKGKEYVDDLKDNEDEASEIYESLESLSKLHKKGVLTDKEFEKKKSDLLDRL